MRIWNVTDGVGDAAIEAETPAAAAREYVYGGDWGERTKTIWITVYVTPEEGGDRDEKWSYKIALDPDEPLCAGGEAVHKWKQTGLQGSGGGVRVYYECTECRLECVEDSWAQDPSDGEEGLASVAYFTPEGEDESEGR